MEQFFPFIPHLLGFLRLNPTDLGFLGSSRGVKVLKAVPGIPHRLTENKKPRGSPGIGVVSAR